MQNKGVIVFFFFHWVCVSQLVDLVLLWFFTGFKLKDFLTDNETLSQFLHHNASLSRHALKQIVEADVNLEKVYFLSSKADNGTVQFSV